MKIFSLMFIVVVVLALLGCTSASPKGKGVGNALKKGGKVIKHGLGAIGIIGTGHQVYQEAKNQG